MGSLKTIVPGVLAGISNIDACAVLCLLSIGSVHGLSLLWALVLGLLLCAFILQLASEIALVTGKGLAENLRSILSPGGVSLTVLTSVAANISLISTEVAGMAIALSTLLGLPLTLAIAASAAIVFTVSAARSLNLIDEVLIALSFTSIVYVLMAFRAAPSPQSIIAGVLTPKVSMSAEYWVSVLAIMGMAVGPNVLFYEACDLVEKGAGEGQLMKAMASPVVGTMVSLIICTAIMICGASLPSVSESLVEVVEAFAKTLGSASTLLFSLGLFACSLLAAVVALHSTVALLSETYGWRGVGRRRDDRAWLTWTAAISLASALPVMLVAEPVKIAIVSGVMCSIATIPPLLSIARLCTDPTVVKGFEDRGFVKAVVWVIVGLFTIINLGGFALIMAEHPVLGYVTLPVDLLIVAMGAPMALILLRKLVYVRRGPRVGG